MHRLLYQEQIRVPLILRLPGVQQVPVVADLVRTVDIAPTIFDYARVEPPAGMGGRSLRPLIEGRDDERRITFAEQINGYDYSAGMVAKRPFDDFSYCAMDGDWKLVWRPNHPDRSELFHISEDPGELTNEWSWDHPEAVRLKRELGSHAPWVTEPFEEVGGDVGGAFEAALESLGYVGGGEKSEGPEWEWVCPEHHGARSETLTRCEECSSAMILIAAGK
jgi:hypothetical protein